MFRNSFWCQPKRREVCANSDTLMLDFQRNITFYDFWMNWNQYSVPIYCVDNLTRRVKVTVINKSTSDLQKLFNLVPMPEGVKAALGTDKHLVVVDYATGEGQEYWHFTEENGQYFCDWGGTFNIYSYSGVVPKSYKNELHGARATSLPLIAGVILKKEAEAVCIPHMLALSLADPLWGFIAPALRTDAFSNQTGIIPAGQIFQLPADVVIRDTWPPLMKAMVIAARDYGIIVVDRSGSTCFYLEDTTRFSTINPFKPYMNNLDTGTFMKLFPASQLKAVRF